MRDAELGRRTPHYDTMAKIALFYNVPPEELMLDASEELKSPKADAPPEKEGERRHTEYEDEPPCAPEEDMEALESVASVVRSLVAAGFMNARQANDIVKQAASDPEGTRYVAEDLHNMAFWAHREESRAQEPRSTGRNRARR